MQRILKALSIGAVMLLGLGTAASSAMMIGDPARKIAGESPLVQKVHNCHSSWRFAWIPQLGYEQEHRHSGGRCNVVIRETGRYGGSYRGAECHGDPRRHRHRGWGTTYHSHHGRRCEIDVWQERRRGYGGSHGCLKVGPVTVCN